MSDQIMDDLGLPPPDFALDIGVPSRAAMSARLQVRISDCLKRERPDLVIVVGDVTSTAAAALAARECGIPVAHVEAGLRSFDRGMPEEINRILADLCSTLLFTSESAGKRNLVREGVPPDRIHFVGNVMVDTLQRFRPKADLGTPASLGFRPNDYLLLTIHRKGNVDAYRVLTSILAGVSRIARRIPVVFPVHPRTRSRMREMGITLPREILACPPLGYLAFVDLMQGARAVLTDSGGVQQESAVLGVPCVTLRDRTELPVTVEIGANRLSGTESARIETSAEEALETPRAGWALPPLWDGHAGERIAKKLRAFLAGTRCGSDEGAACHP
jgi:UDP-N-acetylglucosamine 2-epimerase (non-hydrolysing)